jgi:hypothetical protein
MGPGVLPHARPLVLPLSVVIAAPYLDGPGEHHAPNFDGSSMASKAWKLAVVCLVCLGLITGVVLAVQKLTQP